MRRAFGTYSCGGGLLEPNRRCPPPTPGWPPYISPTFLPLRQRPGPPPATSRRRRRRFLCCPEPGPLPSRGCRRCRWRKALVISGNPGGVRWLPPWGRRPVHHSDSGCSASGDLAIVEQEIVGLREIAARLPLRDVRNLARSWIGVRS